MRTTHKVLSGFLLFVGVVSIGDGLLFPGTWMDEEPALASARTVVSEPRVTERFARLPRWYGGCADDQNVAFAVTGKDRWGTPTELTVCCSTKPAACTPPKSM